MDITQNEIKRHGPESYGGTHRLRTDSPEDGVRCGRIVPTFPPGVFAVEDAARVTCPDCRATLASTEPKRVPPCRWCGFRSLAEGPNICSICEHPYPAPTDSEPAPLGECSSPGCGAEAGPLPGPTSGRDLCPEHRDDERHELERTA